MEKILRIGYVFVLFTVVAGQFSEESLSSSGSYFSFECPYVDTTLELDIERFGGVWYKVAGYPFEITGVKSCAIVQNIPWSNNSFFFNITLFAVDNGAEQVSIGNVTRKQDDTYNIIFFDSRSIELHNWNVLHVDYHSYAVVNSCVFQNELFLGRLVWILSRTPNFDQIHYDKALKAIESFHLSPNPVIRYDQTYCENVKLN